MIEPRIYFPLVVIIYRPYELGDGFDGVGFATSVLDGRECFPIFHDLLDAEEFAKQYGLTDASFQECKNERQFNATLSRAKKRARFQYVSWRDPKDSTKHIFWPIS